MFTLSQTGRFFPNTVGFPIRFSLADMNSSEIDDIESIALTVTRPDSSTFTASLDQNAIVSGKVEYTTQAGDLNAGGDYHYELILSMSGGRTLPILGVFSVPTTDFRTDNTHAARMLALIESALEGRIPAGLEYSTINGQSIARIPISQLSALRDKYYNEVVAERNAALAASGQGNRTTALARFVPMKGFY